MSKLEEQYQKMIETLESTIKDEKELNKAKEQLEDIVSTVVDDCSLILDKYDKKMQEIDAKSKNNELRILALEERLKYFEKMVEMEDYDFFVTCPYCGFEIQTDYDDEVEEICCPECGQLFDIDWEDDSSDEENNENND